MKIKGPWQDIPGFWFDDPQSPDGKRWIATHHGWGLIQAKVREESNGRCELNLSSDCAKSTQYLDTHHRRGRGTGGSKRDDRIWIVGRRNLLATCRNCHNLAKIERKEEIWPEQRRSNVVSTT